MNEVINQILVFFDSLNNNLYYVMYIIVFLWILNVINWIIFKSKLNMLGIIPRKMSGLVGIFFSAFLHGNFNHLFFNTIPLIFLLIVITALGHNIFIVITLKIITLSGLATWVFARRGVHIGASGLIMGYFGFVISNGYLNPGVTSIISVVFMLYYFGSMILSIFPKNDEISWEGHLFGFVSGILVGIKLI